MADKAENIKEARREFADLQAGVGGINLRVSEINEHLTAAGADLSALDPEGKKSAEEMSAAVNEAKRGAHIKEARREFADLQAGVGGINLRVSEINEHLTAAGADLSALDPEGKKSAEEMSAAVNEAKRGAHIKEARREFADLQAGVGDINFRVSEINEHLTAAGADLSALDPEGKKSAEEMSAAVNEAKRGALAKKFAIGSRPGRSVAEG